MVDAQATLDTLRSIKNTIIGNPTAKKTLAADGTVSLVLEWINANDIQEPIFEHIRIEAAHIISAQAYGPPEALLSVLEAQAPQALITALRVSKPGPRLTIALTRALRSVISAAADTIGPLRWHFQRSTSHPARLEARLVLEDTFSPEALDTILPLLEHPEPDARRHVAVMLGRGLVVDTHRARVFEYDSHAAVYSLVKMLKGNTRSQSAATYALAEIARDNDAAARFLSDTTPVERGRPSVRIPASGAEPGSLILPPSATTTARASESPSEPNRVLDTISRFLPSRDGDLREAACLCLSTALRQIRPPLRDPIQAMVMWLNLTIEEFAPAFDTAVEPDPSANPSETKTTEASPSANTWMQKCRWRQGEIGGGPVARRVVGACHILADFVTDRDDLIGYVIHAGTMQRTVRALLALAPIPVPPGNPAPALSGRWGPGTTSTASTVPVPVPAPPPIATRPISLAPPPSPTRARRIGTLSMGSQSTSALTASRPVSYTVLPQVIAVARSPVTTVAPAPVSPPPPIVPVTAGSPPSPIARRLSFAELARRASESGPDAFARRTPSRARRTSSSAGNTVAGTASAAEPGEAHPVASTSSLPAEGMMIDSEQVAEPIEDVTMNPPEPEPAPASAPAPAPMPVNVEAKTEANAPPPAPAPAPPPVARRRRKPPPDPALGPYTYATSSPPPSTTPQVPAPPAPESSLRAALLVALAALSMHSDEHRRLLVEAGALGSVVPGRRTGLPGSVALKPGQAEGVTGVLGALGSPDAEVRWAAVMVVRMMARSTSVLRTGLYDSGIGRAIFDMLMHGEHDRRVLVAVLRVVCNLLNQYSPMREMFMRDGGLRKLAELCDAEEQTIQVLSFWAFKNALFRSTSSEKRAIMDVLTWSRLERALEEPAGELLEQALGIIRNISTTDFDAEFLVTQLAPAKLIDAAERTIGSDDSASLASLFALAHVAFIPFVRPQIVSRRRVLEFISQSLGHVDVQVRSAAALAVAHMAGGVPRRLREMREVGIDAKLKSLRARETDEEVRDNVTRALSVFEAVGV